MSPLVSPTWLVGNLDEPNTVILDATLPPVGVMPPVDTRERYRAKHIPGAIFFDIEALSDPATSLPHMLPSSDVFAASMSALGISNAMRIVVYEQEGVFSAPRARWMLQTFGAPNVFLLDGGLNAWIKAGLPAQSGEVRRPPATFASKFSAFAVKDFADVQKLIAERAQVLDARSAARFNGTAPEPRPGLSSGHMPGTTSVPFTELVEDVHLKSPEALRTLFASKSISRPSAHHHMRLRSHGRRRLPGPRTRRGQRRHPLRRILGRLCPAPRRGHRNVLIFQHFPKITTALQSFRCPHALSSTPTTSASLAASTAP